MQKLFIYKLAIYEKIQKKCKRKENTLLFLSIFSRKLVQTFILCCQPKLEKKAIMPGKKCKKWASFSISLVQHGAKILIKSHCNFCISWLIFQIVHFIEILRNVCILWKGIRIKTFGYILTSIILDIKHEKKIVGNNQDIFLLIPKTFKLQIKPKKLFVNRKKKSSKIIHLRS